MVFSVGQGFSFSEVCDPCVPSAMRPLAVGCYALSYAVFRCVCLCTSQAAYRSQLIRDFLRCSDVHRFEWTMSVRLFRYTPERITCVRCVFSDVNRLNGPSGSA